MVLRRAAGVRTRLNAILEDCRYHLFTATIVVPTSTPISHGSVVRGRGGRQFIQGCMFSGCSTYIKLLIISCPEFAASLGEDAEFVAGDIEWYMSKTALAGEQKAIRRKICERWHQAFLNDLRSFNRIAPLVDHAKGQGTFEIPLL